MTTVTYRSMANQQPQPQQESQSLNKMLENSQIVKFYSKKNVLITGASGFLGKVILWKLIDTCKDIGTIYLLLRSKNNESVEKRLMSILKNKPFAFKYNYEDLMKKVVAIESDITADNLGLTLADREKLCNEVNVVLHSAASVKFDAPLQDNMRDNVYGTRSIIELCNQIKNLNAFVHVSTAYSNCNAKDIREDLVPLQVDVDKVLKIVENLPETAGEELTDKLLEGRPNTYTYTKAVAEHLVARNEGKYPIGIVRPSIVISAADEPCKGWVDNVNGIAGLGSLAAIGVLRTIDWNYHATSDMVPVDYVANCIICAAHEVAERSPSKIRVYNMTSGNMQPISWGRYFEMLRAKATATPPLKIVRPMIESPKYERVNQTKFLLIRIFSELLFAYFVDTILTMLGYKKIMLKITQKMHHGYKILKPFTTNQWNFSSGNVINLSESLTKEDRDTFKFDMRGFDWDEQAQRTWSGARVFILKEENTEEAYKTARTRQTLVTMVHYGFIGIFFALTAFLVLSTGARWLRAS